MSSYHEAISQAQAQWVIESATWQEQVTQQVTMISSWLSMLPLGGRVLDLGCGTGRIMVPLAKKHRQYSFYGVDSSKEMLDCVPAHHNIAIYHNDGLTIPSAIPPINFAYSMLMFQHLPHTMQFNYLEQVYHHLDSTNLVLFQHVIGTENAPLSYQVSISELLQWYTVIGYRVHDTPPDPLQSTWAWVIAQRPQ